MDFYSYGNIEAIQGLLHALVMIFGASDFRDAFRVALIIGFLVASCAAVFQMTYRGWQWLLTVVVLYALLFVPTITITVIDKLAVKPPVVVTNVPWAAGALFAIKSQLGHTLTTLFETALQTIPDPQYQLPAELSFERHGVMFGNRLIRDSRAAVIDNPELRADMINFVRNCVMPEVRSGGLINPTDFARSTNLWALMSNVNPVLMTTYTPPGGAQVVQSCQQTYNDIGTRINGEMLQALQKFASWLYPGVPNAVAQPMIAAALPAAFIKANIAGGATTASELLLQNAMINHVIETGQIIGLSTSDPAATMMSMGRAQATAQINATYASQAAMADEGMPIVRNVVEAFLLGVFPVICLLSFVLEGRALKTFWIGYLFALVWIELWPLVYAIISFVGTTYAAADLAASGYTPTTQGLSLDTASFVYSSALKPSSVVGNMMLALPALAAALLWGFGRITGAIPSMKEMFAPGSGAIAEAARGNTSQGLLSMDKHLMTPRRESPFVDEFQSDADGSTWTILPDGKTAVRMPQNDVPVTAQLELSRAVEQSRLASKAATLARTEGIAAEVARVGGFAQVVSSSRARGTSQEIAAGVDKSLAKDDLATVQHIDQLATSFQARFGVSDGIAAQAAVRASLGLPFIGSLSAGLNSGTSAEFKRAYDDAKSGISLSQRAQVEGLQDRLMTSEQVRNSLVSSQQGRDEVAAKFDESRRHSESQQLQLAKARALQEQASELAREAVKAGANLEKDPAFTSMLQRIRAQSRDLSVSPAHQALVANQLLAEWLLSQSEMRMPGRFLGGKPVPSDLEAAYERQRNHPAFADGSSGAFERGLGRGGPMNTEKVGAPKWATEAPQTISDFREGQAARRNKVTGGVNEMGDRVGKQVDLRDDLDREGKGGLPKSSVTVRAARTAGQVLDHVPLPPMNSDRRESKEVKGSGAGNADGGLFSGTD